MPAVVNFCRREQGILVPQGNPKKITGVADLARPGVTIVNRPVGTGTRLLLDREFKKAGIDGEKIDGYVHEVHRHLEVGLEILAGRADAGPAIGAVAGLLNMGFIPIRWERFDLMILKDRFFDEGIHILTTGFPIIPIDRGAMVRISMSAAHTDEQIERLLDAFRKLREVPYCKTRAPGEGRCPL